LSIDDLQEKEMAGSTGRANKRSAQLQMATIDYMDETKSIELRQNNGWDLTRGSRRERLEIMAEILCYCNQQKTKTNIMYKVNLNYTQLKKHLKSLTAQGLLTTNKNKYATTQKGNRFLELFAQLNAILNS
jgi:predicted transcriptional regulator